MDPLIDILDELGRPRVILVGDFMLDEYVYGDVERISPEAPVPVLRVIDRETRAGGAGNVATAAAALGAEVVCLGAIGQDAAGERLTVLLNDAGADTQSLIALAHRPTTRKTRYVGLSQHKNPHQILREDEEIITPLTDAELQPLLESLKAQLQQGPAIVAMQDHNKGLLSGDGAQQVIALAREAGADVLVDPALLRDFTRYEGCAYLTPNRYEAGRACDMQIDDDPSLHAAAESILQATKARVAIITLDKQGALIAPAGEAPYILPPGRTHEVADGTGAGDAVLAALSVALGAGADLNAAVALANLAGGLEVERFGVVPVTREEMIAELRSRVGTRESKVVGRDRLVEELARRRALPGSTVVFTNGCFDLLHMGHVSYLQQARQEGTCLIVGVNSDDSVRRLKGPTRPIIPADERAGMLAALECVDYVTIFDEDTPVELLEVLRPDLLVKGGSTPVIVGEELVESYGGQVRRLDLVEGRSTTDIIDSITESG